MYNKSRLSKYSDLRQNAGTNNETTEVDSDRLSDYASRIERITNQKAADNMAFRGENNYTPNRSRSSSADGYAGFNGSNANASSANYFSAEPDYDKLVKEQEDFLKRIDNDFSAATSRSGTASYNQQPAGSGSQSVSSSPNYNYGSNNSYQPVNMAMRPDAMKIRQQPIKRLLTGRMALRSFRSRLTARLPASKHRIIISLIISPATSRSLMAVAQ